MPALQEPRPAGVLRAHQYFALSFGAIIGVGWIIMLGGWLETAGPGGAALGFGLGALLTALVALCYAELATIFTGTGGEIAYTERVFGPRLALAVGWMVLLAHVATVTFVTVGIGLMLGRLLPALAGPELYAVMGEPVRAGGLAAGLLGTAFVAMLNLRGVSASARLQDWTTVGLVVLFMTFVGAAFANGSTQNLEPLFQGSGGDAAFVGVIAVFVMAPFWYSGFQVVPQLLGEKSPGVSVRTVALTMVAGVLGAGAFYCTVIIAASMTQPWPTLVEMELPTARTFEIAFKSRVFADVVIAAGLLGLLSTWNAFFLSSTRILVALGARGLLPASTAVTQSHSGTPRTAVLIVAALGAAGAVGGSGVINAVASVAAVGFGVSYLVTCAALFRVRRSTEMRAGTFRAPGGLVVIASATAFSIFMIAMAIYTPWSGDGAIPLEWVLLGAWLAAGAVLRALSSRQAESGGATA